MEQLLELLKQNPTTKLSLNIIDEQEDVTSEPYRLRGCIFSTVERMDDEFTKMLQACDAHSPDYVERSVFKICLLLLARIQTNFHYPCLCYLLASTDVLSGNVHLNLV